jgi:Tol biopolymer transport system component
MLPDILLTHVSVYTPLRTGRLCGRVTPARTLVTASRDPVDARNPAKVAIWDLPSGKIERVLQAAHPAFALAFSPDGKWLALSLKDKQLSLLSSVGQVDSPP